MADNIGLVLFTRFVNHSVINGIRARKPAYSRALGLREIRDILESCADILLHSPKPVAREGPKAGATGPPGRIISLEAEAERLELVVLDFLIRTRRTVMPDDGMTGFVPAFLRLAEGSEDGTVGKMTTTRLRKQHDIRQEPRQLAKKGWLVPVVLPGGKKVSKYKPGEKMLGQAAAPELPEPPENPYELALWFAEQEPVVRARREAIRLEMEDRFAELEAERKARLAEVDAEIADIEKAKGALEQLNSLKRPTKKAAE